MYSFRSSELSFYRQKASRTPTSLSHSRSISCDDAFSFLVPKSTTENREQEKKQNIIEKTKNMKHPEDRARPKHKRQKNGLVQRLGRLLSVVTFGLVLLLMPCKVFLALGSSRVFIHKELRDLTQGKSPNEITTERANGEGIISF